ncbi:MAG: nucleoside hydrolase-like domain-containing protein [Terracidiphilus sp.]
MNRRSWRLIGVLAGLASGAGLVTAQGLPATHVDDFRGKPRVIVISDIGNEPDDQMSLVRLLLYSNELEIEGLIATTSTWQKTAIHPETMRKLVEAYGQVRPHLLLHAKGWPEAQELMGRIYAGQTAYGMAATGEQKSSEGAAAIVRAVERDDPRPLWVCLWGGANTLAQALMDLRTRHTAAEMATLAGRLRVSAISDQDDAGPWIRREFPDLLWVGTPSTPTGGEYASATWTGISGDAYYRNGEGADFTTVTNEWLEAHIRKGPLGKLYPRFLFIMEGDTPSYLGLIDNGLNAYRRPDWGGWGGRYIHRQPYGETHAIWTQGGDEFARVTSQDSVVGADGKEHVSDQATIWRWRTAFQNDFAARMAWTLEDYSHASHEPLAVLNGKAGTTPVEIEVTVGQAVTLDAGRSTDPDGRGLDFHWFHYAEAGIADGNLAAVTLTGAETARVTVRADAVCRPMWLPGVMPCSGSGVAHIVLAVTNRGSLPLTSYRRVILHVRPADAGK